MKYSTVTKVLQMGIEPTSFPYGANSELIRLELVAPPKAGHLTTSVTGGANKTIGYC